MNTEQQNYHDYLLPLSSMDCALSYARVRNDDTSNFTTEELDYHTYRTPLTPSEQYDADYNIFSSMYDTIDVSLHGQYDIDFENQGYSLEAKCKKKSPEN